MPTLTELAEESKATLDGREGTPAPPKAIKRIAEGEKQMRREESRWRELWAHFDGEQFTEVSAVDGSLQQLETREGSTHKPRHRPRLVRNRMTKGIVSEVSTLTSRFPTWEVLPSNHDRDKMNAARTGEKALQFLNDHLKLRRTTFKVGINAAVTGDGYAWPYWNPNLGPVVGDAAELEAPEGFIAAEPFAPDPDVSALPEADALPSPADELGELGTLESLPEAGPARPIRQGDIQIAVLRQDQVLWQPGVEFEESRWHAVRLVRPVEDIISRPDYIGPSDLKGDASADQMQRDKPVDAKMVFLYHYLERPCDEYPEGRWLQIAGGKEVFPEDKYPCAEDIPVVHRMPWIERGSRRERSLGLGEQLIDIQRSINRIVNQVISWRNLALNPQVFAPEGSLQDAITDEPGLVVEYRGNVPPQWRDVPPIPAGLFQDLERCYYDMDYILNGGTALPTGVESGSAIAGINEREMSFRSHVLGSLADFYSSLGYHLLYLVAAHYTEERLIQIKGRFGTESIPDFLGAALQGRIGGVRVTEGSITPRTRAAQEAKIAMFADRGWITPQQAMSALNGGTAGEIIDSFELDVARVHRQIQLLVELDRTGEVPEGMDPMTMLPEAKPYDNHEVFIDIIRQWCKTVEFERMHPLVQEAALNWLEMHKYEIEMEMAQQAQQLMLQAGGQGMGAAGKPQTAPGAPTQPSLKGNAEALAGQVQ